MKLRSLQLFADAGEQTQVCDTPASDETSAETTQKTDTDETQKDTDSEFEELIKGKFASAFAKRTQGIIDKRFGKFKSYEKTALAAKPLLDVLRKEHPEIAPDDEKSLFEILGNSKTAPLEKNTDFENAKAAAQVLAKTRAEETVRRELIESWKKQGEELREMYPDFSLENELKAGGDFAALLKAGVSVKKAYETANLEKIVGAAMRYASTQAAKKTAESIRSGQARPGENSVLNRAAAVTHTDVRSLTERDIIRIINDVSKGAKITF